MATNGDRPNLLERTVDRVPFLEKELFLLRRMVRAGDVCLDIGAAGGAHLLVMARQVGSAGRVFGIEPRPASRRTLARIVRWSGLADRVRLLEVALSDRVGRMALRIPVVPTRAHFRGSSRDADAVAAFAGLPNREIEVLTLPLDTVVQAEGLDRLDVLKCDVEGAELLVLAGGERVISDLRPTMIIEADNLHQRRYDATARDVLEAVTTYDYRAFRYVRGGLAEVVAPIPDEDDYVFVPAERTPPVPVRSAP